jgi:hypothetical protein
MNTMPSLTWFDNPWRLITLGSPAARSLLNFSGVAEELSLPKVSDLRERTGRWRASEVFANDLPLVGRLQIKNGDISSLEIV